MAHSGTMKASAQGEPFRSVLAQDPLGSVSELCAVFSNRDVPFISVEKARLIGSGCMFGSSLNSPDQQLKKELLMSDVGVFVRWSLTTS